MPFSSTATAQSVSKKPGLPGIGRKPSAQDLIVVAIFTLAASLLLQQLLPPRLAVPTKMGSLGARLISLPENSTCAALIRTFLPPTSPKQPSEAGGGVGGLVGGGSRWKTARVQ